MGERTFAERVYEETFKGKRSLERPRRSWGIILQLVFKNGNLSSDWIDLAQHRNK
jgi:hypothetical protein